MDALALAAACRAAPPRRRPRRRPPFPVPRRGRGWRRREHLAIFARRLARQLVRGHGRPAAATPRAGLVREGGCAKRRGTRGWATPNPRRVRETAPSASDCEADGVSGVSVAARTGADEVARVAPAARSPADTSALAPWLRSTAAHTRRPRPCPSRLARRVRARGAPPRPAPRPPARRPRRRAAALAPRVRLVRTRGSASVPPPRASTSTADAAASPPRRPPLRLARASTSSV